MFLGKKRDKSGISKRKPCVLVFGPGLEQGGGVATFVSILLSSPKIRDNFRLVHLDTTRNQNAIGLENRFSILNLIYFFRQIFQFLIIVFRTQPRIMHLPITSGLAFWKSAIFIYLSQTFRIRVVAHLHGGIFDQFYRGRKPLEQKLISLVLYHSDVVVALSKNWRRFLLEEVRPDINVEIVSNSIDQMFAQALDQGSNHESHKYYKEKIILFVGSLGFRKGVFDVLNTVPLVCAKHPDARFFFAGREEIKGEKRQIDRICKENDLLGSAKFLGVVTGLAKLELFHRSMVYILPSYGENLPYSLLEAMSVGLPVITTPVGAIPEIIEDGRNGFLIEPGDYKSLANRIIQLLDEPELRATMSKANIDGIMDSFLPEVIMNQFQEMYNRLLIME